MMEFGHIWTSLEQFLRLLCFSFSLLLLPYLARAHRCPNLFLNLFPHHPVSSKYCWWSPWGQNVLLNKICFLLIQFFSVCAVLQYNLCPVCNHGQCACMFDILLTRRNSREHEIGSRYIGKKDGIKMSFLFEKERDQDEEKNEREREREREREAITEFAHPKAWVCEVTRHDWLKSDKLLPVFFFFFTWSLESLQRPSSYALWPSMNRKNGG